MGEGCRGWRQPRRGLGHRWRALSLRAEKKREARKKEEKGQGESHGSTFRPEGWITRPAREPQRHVDKGIEGYFAPNAGERTGDVCRVHDGHLDDSRGHSLSALRIRGGPRGPAVHLVHHPARSPRDHPHGAGGGGNRDQPKGGGRRRLLHDQPLLWPVHRGRHWNRAVPEPGHQCGLLHHCVHRVDPGPDGLARGHTRGRDSALADQLRVHGVADPVDAHQGSTSGGQSAIWRGGRARGGLAEFLFWLRRTPGGVGHPPNHRREFRHGGWPPDHPLFLH